MLRCQCRRLVVVLGDQLDRNSVTLREFEGTQNKTWMAESADESKRVWSHKAQIAVSLMAMRQSRDCRREHGCQVNYTQLDDERNRGTLAAELTSAIDRLRPDRVIMVEPSEYRAVHALRTLAGKCNVKLEVRAAEHFLSTDDEFNNPADGCTQLRQKLFDRELRKKRGVLMDSRRRTGGKRNDDAKIRQSFGRKGRGVFWRFKPENLRRNELGADSLLPEFYWTSETDLHCLRQSVGLTPHKSADELKRICKQADELRQELAT